MAKYILVVQAEYLTESYKLNTYLINTEDLSVVYTNYILGAIGKKLKLGLWLRCNNLYGMKYDGYKDAINKIQKLWQSKDSKLGKIVKENTEPYIAPSLMDNIADASIIYISAWN